MKLKTLFFSFLFSLPFFTGCDVARQVGGAYNVINCKYDYNSINNINLAGIDFNQGLSLTNATRATTLLSGRSNSSVPLNFTVNLDVTNPNQSAALLNGLDYILSIDNIQFTNGSVAQQLNVPAGGKSILPLTIGFDLATLLSGDSADAVGSIVRNFVGIGEQKSNVTLQIRPTFMVANTAVPSPVYIPISFTFGGKK